MANIHTLIFDIILHFNMNLVKHYILLLGIEFYFSTNQEAGNCTIHRISLSGIHFPAKQAVCPEIVFHVN